MKRTFLKRGFMFFIAILLLTIFVYADSASCTLSTYERSDSTKNDLVYGTNNGTVSGSLSSGTDMRVKGMQCNELWWDYVLVQFSVDQQHPSRSGGFTPNAQHGYYVRVEQISGSSSGTGRISCY